MLSMHRLRRLTREGLVRNRGRMFSGGCWINYLGARYCRVENHSIFFPGNYNFPVGRRDFYRFRSVFPLGQPYLEQVKITGSGFDICSSPSNPRKPVEPLAWKFEPPHGTTVAVETTSDLSTWTETQRITGQGAGSPVKITLQPDPNVQTKFWRVRIR